jgi:hypothetical protein
MKQPTKFWGKCAGTLEVLEYQFQCKQLSTLCVEDHEVFSLQSLNRENAGVAGM